MSDNNIKILVVDDEEIIRMGCKRVLEDSGYSVEIAENGKVGLEMIKANSYDMAFIDLMMPEMGGMELLDNIQQIDTNIICIIITGFATIETAVEGVKRGAYDYLPKPFSPDDLRAKLERGLEKRRLYLEAEQLRRERDNNLLECSNEKTRTLTILNCMSEGLIATNNMGQIVLCNPVASQMLRLKGDFIEKYVNGTLQNEFLEGKIISSLNAANVQSISRFEVDLPTGQTLQASITALRDDNDEILGSVTVLVDITDEKRIEKTKSQFVRLVSHELKAPIGAIEGYLNLIVEGLTANNPEKEKSIILKSRDKAHNLIEMINDLLDLSKTERKIDEKHIKSLDMKEIMDESIDFYRNEAKEKDINLQYTVDENIEKVRGVMEELSRVCANLISNAIKYTPEKGWVNVSIKQENHHIHLVVQDSGIGMSSVALEKIFDEFYRAENAVQSKITGTGLGLSIAHKIVKDHNGYIDVKSKLSEGSTFTVVLPTIKNK